MKKRNHDHKRCVSVFRKLSEYIDGELDEKRYEIIERHLRECVRCEVCLETLKRTVEICRNMKMREVPERLRERLKALG